MAAVLLEGTPVGSLWATVVVSYAMGPGGVEAARVNGLGSNLTDHTMMGDRDTEIVLGFTTPLLDHPRDLRTAASGPDLVLTWLPPPNATAVDGYEVFASPTPIGFDFTSADAFIEGEWNLTWTPGDAASVPGEWYYVVRSYNETLGWRSETSNTAGAFTKFPPAARTLSPTPLEPYAPLDVSAFRTPLNGSSMVRHHENPPCSHASRENVRKG
jgi:hypothetical protein